MSLLIPSRFQGPDGSGNGGYVSGLLAARAGAAPGGTGAVVTLRRPPPLEVPLAVVADGDGVLRLQHGDAVVAEAARSRVDVEPVPPVDADTARATQDRYAGLRSHPFPRCFVCGPLREPGDGMRLQPGSLAEGRTACTWTVGADLAGSPEFVWAALDCPGGWTAGIEGRPLVLGRMAARVADLPRAGETCVVVGRRTGGEGRKTWTASTAYGADGRVLGVATATWIAVAPGSAGT